jgi:CubicO group peptidase (beta-lactamase class C family)
MIRKNGQTVFLGTYGLSNMGTRQQIAATTNFRLASVTKQFTALAVMLLVHDGKLDYDRRLTDVFSDFPPYGKQITIRELLTHTSGLPDYESLMGSQWSPTRQINDTQVLRLLMQQNKCKFVPGTSWAYSNSAFVVLGLIVAKLSGESFPQFLHHRIFRPLRMDSTLAYVRGLNDVPNRAFGYSKDDRGNFVETDQSATSATLGDGGVYSNVLDLAKWDDALRKGTLLDHSEMSAAYTPVELANGSNPSWPAEPGEDNLDPGSPVAYGFGWFVDPYQGHARMWHSGTTSGFRTVIERFPSEQLSVVILCNRTDLDPSAIALRLADTYLAPEHRRVE